MFIWIVILIIAIVLLVASVGYLASRFSQLELVDVACSGRRGRKRLLSVAIVAAIFGTCTFTMDVPNAVIVLIHLTLFWLLIDLGAILIARFRARERNKNFIALAAILGTLVYLGIGWYLVHNVWQTDYKLTTDKKLGDLKVLQISDSHVGATFHGADMKEYVDRMNQNKPDVAVLTGDFVDDDSSKEDMIEAARELGKLKTRYGIYFIYGNHDKGYYGSRGYSGQDVIDELAKNGIRTLQDETTLVADRFYLIGRLDASETREKNGSRKSMAELTEGLDQSKYMIVLDHQPVDYDAQQKAGVDLVLSGHTHGGQMFPITHMGEIMGINDGTAGLYKRGKTDYIVNTGISDWSLQFKTGTKSEYVVVDIDGK